MKHDNWHAFVEEVVSKIRPHAGYFAWAPNRPVEERGAVDELMTSLEAEGQAFFHSPQSRSPDPPDLEALLFNGERLGIEVTELVDGDAIVAAKTNRPYPQAPYTEAEISDLLSQRIAEKDSPASIHGGPYAHYMLLIYCDEPRVLDYGLLDSVRYMTFSTTRLINRAFLLLSYNALVQRCPYIELRVRDA